MAECVHIHDNDPWLPDVPDGFEAHVCKAPALRVPDENPAYGDAVKEIGRSPLRRALS